MNKLLISDYHARSNGAFANLVEPRKQENLQKVLDEWQDKVDRIVITGDFFDKPEPNHSLVTEYARIFKTLGKNIEKVVFIVGNHDPILRSENAISAFAEGTMTNGKGMDVVTANQVLADYESKTVYHAWCSGTLRVTAPETNWDYFGHIQVKDWIKFSDQGHSLKEIEAMGFRRAYLGDFHPFVDGGRVVSIGTFGASDFRDEGLKSGYIVTEDDGSFKRYEFSAYPMFKTFNFYLPNDFEDFALHEYASEFAKKNICKVKMHGLDKDLTDENIDKVRWLFAQFLPLDLKIEKVYTDHQIKQEKKPLLGFSDLLAKHYNSWPEVAQKEYNELLQRE